LKEAILNKIDDFAMSDDGELIEGYLAMAKDAAREREAEEWSEGLIGDSFPVKQSALSPFPSAQRGDLL
jgi:hypothetical protein